jgi:hypothetical protein
MKENYEQYLITAGGRIRCHRCQAQSTRSKLQCSRPSSKISKTHKCNFHGAGSTGPKTQEGVKRIQNAHWKHGNETKEAKAERRRMSLMFQRLEEIGWHIGLFAAGSTKTRGRKIGKKLDLKDPEQLQQALIESMKILRNP